MDSASPAMQWSFKRIITVGFMRSVYNKSLDSETALRKFSTHLVPLGAAPLTLCSSLNLGFRSNLY